MLKNADLLRFWRTIEKGDDDACWPWRGPVNARGYGRFNADGTRYTATRLALALRIGRDLTGAELACHSCDNPSCVNPGHLFVGSEADNRADCVAKGRARIPDRRGTKNARAKLSDEQVAQIRGLKGERLQRDIAARFGVSRQTVSAIQNGDRWSVSGAVPQGGAPNTAAQKDSPDV